VVGPGVTVTVRFAGDDEGRFLLASREESGAPIDVYSPLGSTINGKKIGGTAIYSLPNGRATTVEILGSGPLRRGVTRAADAARLKPSRWL